MTKPTPEQVNSLRTLYGAEAKLETAPSGARKAMIELKGEKIMAKFGERINTKHMLKRVRNPDGSVFWQRCKVIDQVKYRNAIYLGKRTLYNGKRWYDEECGWRFEKEEHFAAHLVCAEGLNPVYVLEEDFIC